MNHTTRGVTLQSAELGSNGIGDVAILELEREELGSPGGERSSSLHHHHHEYQQDQETDTGDQEPGQLHPVNSVPVIRSGLFPELGSPESDSDSGAELSEGKQETSI